MTRATELRNLLFYDYDENAEREVAMLQYFTRKVDRYKQQDKKARREVDDQNYVTVAWLLGCLGTSCSGCGDALVYEKGKSNLTAQRIDNAVGHELDNVVPMCTFCNCAFFTNLFKGMPLIRRYTTVMSITFTFLNSGFKVHQVSLDGTPWFRGKDVAIILGYRDTRSAIRDT